jgi:hypothetical protein
MRVYDFVRQECIPLILEQLTQITGENSFADEIGKEHPFGEAKQHAEPYRYHDNRRIFINALDVMCALFERDYVKKII